ncbi:MAG: IS30 family transposase [Spirochaetia bacterium]|nr:IS30 family transposase [Spirochaetia bacterium]
MRSQFRHLNLSDRNVINNMLKNGSCKKEIAIALNVHKSTIYREINRSFNYGKYEPYIAQENYIRNRKYCIYYRNWNMKIFSHIKEQIKKGFSPDSIAGRLKFCNDETMRISHQTIYNWIIQKRLGEDLQKFLLFGKKGYKKSEKSLKTLKNKAKRRIDKMPNKARFGTRIGHFQADTMHGKNQSGALATFVDIFSKYVLADKIEDKKADSFSSAMRFLFSDIDNKKLRTILEDNGSEMANFETDEEMLNCKIFFTYPGRPWEKALIENSNRMLRRFFPKNKNFKNIDREKVLQAVNWINHMPRKSLGYRTAYEVFHDINCVAFEI